MRTRISRLLVAFALAFPLTITAQQTEDRVYEAADGVTLPKVIKNVKPYYTPDAMDERVQGEVRLRCVVTKAGVPTRIEVTQPLDERLDKQAVAALEQWRFEAGRKDGSAVAVRVAIQMTFTLK